MFDIHIYIFDIHTYILMNHMCLAYLGDFEDVIVWNVGAPSTASCGHLILSYYLVWYLNFYIMNFSNNTCRIIPHMPFLCRSPYRKISFCNLCDNKSSITCAINK